MRGCWKLKFLKEKGNFSTENNVLAYFPRSIVYDKFQGTINKGPQSILTITVEDIGSILKT